MESFDVKNAYTQSRIKMNLWKQFWVVQFTQVFIYTFDVFEHFVVKFTFHFLCLEGIRSLRFLWKTATFVSSVELSLNERHRQCIVCGSKSKYTTYQYCKQVLYVQMFIFQMNFDLSLFKYINNSTCIWCEIVPLIFILIVKVGSRREFVLFTISLGTKSFWKPCCYVLFLFIQAKYSWMFKSFKLWVTPLCCIFS